jgi:hypothetical protein
MAHSIEGGACRFLISLKSSRATITVTLISLEYGPRQSCLSPAANIAQADDAARRSIEEFVNTP